MKKRPNILFILTDQQRKDTLSAYGDSLCNTPVLDQLTEESCLFENAYTTCPICTPARASLQTGLYPMHHGMLTNSYNYGNMIQELPDSPQLLSRSLARQGYQVGYTGKWHLGSGAENARQDQYIQKYMGNIQFPELTMGDDGMPTTRGYYGDDFPGHGFGGHHYPQFKDYLAEKGLQYTVENIQTGFYGGHQAGVVTSGVASTVEHFLVERAQTILSEFDKNEEPWYLQLNFWGPHEPYFVPEEFYRQYEGVSLAPWKNFTDKESNKPRIHDVKRGDFTTWEEIEPIVKHYFAGVSHIDYQIGRMLAYLKEHDLYEDTVIIFSSDHGESLGIHDGLCDKALFMYEETCSIPLMIKPAGVNKAQKRTEFTNSCDIYSTILDYAGMTPADFERDGTSLRPLVAGETLPWRDAVVTECSGIGSVLFSQRMIRKGNYKYVFNVGDIDELYDLQNDPYEMENLVDHDGYQQILNEMRLALFDWMLENNDNLIFEFQEIRLKNQKQPLL